MTSAQAAEYTGLDRSRLRQLVKAGELKADLEDTPRGPVLWFHKAELDRLKEKRAKAAEERKGRPGRPLKTAPQPPDAEKGPGN